jgi:hypothetical protein
VVVWLVGAFRGELQALCEMRPIAASTTFVKGDLLLPLRP